MKRERKIGGENEKMWTKQEEGGSKNEKKCVIKEGGNRKEGNERGR